MGVEEAIDLIEESLGEDIRKLSPKDRILVYDRLLEYKRPKIQRSTFEHGLDTETEIIIRYEENKEPDQAITYKDIQEPLGGSEED